MSVNPSVEASDIAAFVTYARANSGTLSYASPAMDRSATCLANSSSSRPAPTLSMFPTRAPPCPRRRSRWPGPGLLRQSAVVAAAGARRSSAATRGVGRGPRSRAARRADLRRGRVAGHELDGIFRPDRAKGAAGTCHREIEEAVGQALALPKTREMLAAQQAIVVDFPPTVFKAAIKREYDRMQRIVAAGNITLN